MSVRFHIHRAKAVLKSAYDLDHWQKGVGDLSGYHRHRTCIEIDKTRRQLARKRVALKQRFHVYRQGQVAFGDLTPPGEAWLASTRACESGGNYSTNTGNGYYGAYQFDLATWASVGGSGLPSSASPAEQDYRAALLYRRAGSAPWPVCG